MEKIFVILVSGVKTLNELESFVELKACERTEAKKEAYKIVSSCVNMLAREDMPSSLMEKFQSREQVFIKTGIHGVTLKFSEAYINEKQIYIPARLNKTKMSALFPGINSQGPVVD